jgi:hypothetical protein
MPHERRALLTAAPFFPVIAGLMGKTYPLMVGIE